MPRNRSLLATVLAPPAEPASVSPAVEANARLTASLGAVLFVLLAAEGITILRIHQLLSAHVFVGMLMIPPVVAKLASTGWRFTRYYRRDPDYRRKGPPPLLLRLLGPVVVALTVIVLASGVALIVVPASATQTALFLHKASFVLWLGAMAIHVLGHLRDTVELAPKDWTRRPGSALRGAPGRLLVLALTLLAGAGLGLATLGSTGNFHLEQHLR